MRRVKIKNKKADRKRFHVTANKTNKINRPHLNLRGGIRL